MLDRELVDLYWARSEDAIAETEKKYGPYCRTIAYNILGNHEDTAECVNDTYLKAWNSMPDAKPEKLSAFLGKITRNLALNMREQKSAKKRGGGQTEAVLEELAFCVSGCDTPDAVVDRMHFRALMDSFLQSLSKETRCCFVARYFGMYSVSEIAKQYGLREDSVRDRLRRARVRLKEILEREGMY